MSLPPRLRPSIRFALLALVLAVLVETVVFNLPSWRSVAASGDSAAASNALGPGVERTVDGLLRVTDPTQAWVEVDADGSSPYWRLESPSSALLAEARGELGDALADDVHVRVVCDGRASAMASASPLASRSLYFEAPAHGLARVWFEEPAGTVVPVTNVRANVRVPFGFDWVRVALMLAVMLLGWALRPRSWLWRTRLDPADRLQRRLLAAGCTVLGVAVMATVVPMAANAVPLAFHEEGGYTFDFDQYDHVATALLHGHPWLDLEVPDRLAALTNPYDTAQRSRLLADGVTPIYWDYAYRDGHWYSYFGVLPAVLLFLPYRAVTSLFVPGGLPLPATCAELVLMAIATVLSVLLVMRILHRVTPRIPLAGALLLCVAYQLGANFTYLWFRTNFYSVPIAAALCCATGGLLAWTRATRPDGSPRLGRVAVGAALMAATLGCRPTFALAALLAVPRFLPAVRRLLRGRDMRGTLAFAAALLLPALAVVAPVLAYNAVRFGSVLDFGNAYQVTVTDMTRFATPASNVLPTIGYYLFLPLHVTDAFPWLATSPTPMAQWSFGEPTVCGLAVAMPLLLAAFALPWCRRRCAGWWPMLVTALALAVALTVFDAMVGGFGWRYMADFGWLFMLAAIVPCALAMQRHAWARAVVTLAVAWGVAIAVLSWFTIGRDDMLVHNNPALFYAVQSWFALL